MDRKKIVEPLISLLPIKSLVHETLLPALNTTINFPEDRSLQAKPTEMLPSVEETENVHPDSTASEGELMVVLSSTSDITETDK